jgi:hypothetical protein
MSNARPGHDTMSLKEATISHMLEIVAFVVSTIT